MKTTWIECKSTSRLAIYQAALEPDQPLLLQGSSAFFSSQGYALFR